MVIAFTGLKGSGKSEACKYIESIVTNAVRINFKDALVQEMKERLPDVLRRLSEQYQCTIDELFATKPPIMRELMQNYGTEVRRGDYDTYWTDQWHNAATEAELSGRRVLVDDCRFLNEAQAVRALNGTIIRIVRPDIAATDTHQSETEMDQIAVDHTVQSITGDLEGMYAQLHSILNPGGTVQCDTCRAIGQQNTPFGMLWCPTTTWHPVLLKVTCDRCKDTKPSST